MAPGLFLSALTDHEKLSLYVYEGTLLELLRGLVGPHIEASASKVSVKLAAYETSIFVSVNSDAKDMPEICDDFYGSFRSHTAWRRVNMPSAIFQAEQAQTPDEVDAALHTFGRIDQPATLPKLVAGGSFRGYTERVQKILSEQWDSLFYRLWAPMCPEQPVTVSFELPGRAKESFMLTPWTAARLVPSSTDDFGPQLINVTGPSSLVTASQFECGLNDNINDTLVVRTFGGINIEASVRAALSLGQLSLWRPEPVAAPEPEFADELEAAFAPLAPSALSTVGSLAMENEGIPASSSPVFGQAYSVEPVPTATMDMAREKANDASMDAFAVRLMFPEYSAWRLDFASTQKQLYIKRARLFSRVMARSMAAVTAAFSKDAVPQQWTIGIFSKPVPAATWSITATAAEAAAFCGVSDSGTCAAVPDSVGEVGYAIVDAINVPVFGFNVAHPALLKYGPLNAAASTGLVLDAAAGMLAKLTGLDRASVGAAVFAQYGSVSFMMDCFDEMPEWPAAVEPIMTAPAAAPVAATAPIMTAPAVTAPTIARVAIMVPSTAAGGPKRRRSAAFDDDDDDEAFGAEADGERKKSGKRRGIKRGSVGAPKLSVLYKAWNMIAQGYEGARWPTVVPMPEKVRNNEKKQIEYKLRARYFAKPPKGEAKRGGCHLDPAAKVPFLLAELENSAAMGVSPEEVFTLLEAHKVLYTGTSYASEDAEQAAPYYSSAAPYYSGAAAADYSSTSAAAEDYSAAVADYSAASAAAEGAAAADYGSSAAAAATPDYMALMAILNADTQFFTE